MKMANGAGDPDALFQREQTWTIGSAPMRSSMVVLFVLVLLPATAQTFDLEQFEQIFRPRLKVDTRWTPPASFTDQEGTYEDRAVVGVFTVPVYQRWSAGIDLNAEGKGVVERLKNSVRIRASQVLANGRVGIRELRIGSDGDVRTLYTGSVGALGVSLTRNFRVLFWSANVNVSEEESTVDQMVPRFNGVIGKLRINGARKQLFYGLAVTLSDGLNLPIPFVGGTEPIGDRWSFQYVLPVQLAVGFKLSDDTRFQGGVGADGFRSGFAQGDDRVNFNYTALRAFVNVRHRLSRTVQLRAEIAGLPVRQIRLPDPAGDLQRYPINAGWSVQGGINIFFGNSTLERILDTVL